MYYKVLSQSGAVTLTVGNWYYKVGQVLQSGVIITKYGNRTSLLINFSGFLTLKIFEATFKETMLSRMFYLQI